jgi:hypothetical protein
MPERELLALASARCKLTRSALSKPLPKIKGHIDGD